MNVKDNLVKTMEQLSIPRRCGSKGHEKARRFVFESFNSAFFEKDRPRPEDNKVNEKINQFRVYEQPFSFARDTVRVAYGIIALLLITCLYANLYFLIKYETPLFRHLSLFSSAGVILILFSGTHWNNLVEAIVRRKSKNSFETANVIAHINVNAPKNLVFSAHYDSKSDAAGFFQRFLFGAVAYGASVLTALYTLWLYIYTAVKNPVITYNVALLRTNHVFSLVSILVMIILSYFYFSKVNNESPGAIDNATGVAVLIELARHFACNLPEKVNLWFVATSAEEEGMVGIVRFLDECESQLDKNNTFLINLDCVGGDGDLDIINAYGFPVKYTSKELPRNVKKAADAVGVKARIRWAPPGVGFDSLPPAHRGYETVDLSNCRFNHVLWSIHSKDDTIMNVIPEGMEETFMTCKKMAE